MKLSGSTTPFAVLGHPIGHTLSPVMHNSAFKALEMDAVYLAFDVAPGTETWNLFLEHSANRMILSPYNLAGNYSVVPGDLPSHHLLIDTEDLTAYVGIGDQSTEFLSLCKPEGWIARLDNKAQVRLGELIKQTMQEMTPRKIEEFRQKYETRTKNLREKLRLSMDLTLRLN